jgi:dynein heavy chain
VNNVISFFTYSVYTNVCRSLFEKDKLLFSFVLTTSILESKGQIDPSEYQYFISPPSGAGTLESPLKWLTNYSWNKIKELAHINDYFAKLPFSFTENSEKWEKIYDSQDAHKMPFPEPFMAATHMQRLCILKAIRPDRVIGGIREFIIQQMGVNFITPPAFDLQKSFAEAEKI